MSASYRIALIYTAVFSLVTAILGAAVYVAAEAHFRGHQDAEIKAESDELVHEYGRGALAELRDNIVRRETDNVDDAFAYAVFDIKGRRIIGRFNTPRPAVGWHDLVFSDARGDKEFARTLATQLPGENLLVVALDAKDVQEINHTILQLFVAAVAVVLIAGGAGAVILGNYIGRRLERIRRTAEAILDGDFSRRISVGQGADEFDKVGRSLNLMLDRIADLLENLRQVSSDVAHDMRTPLARLRGEIEASLQGPPDIERQRLALINAREQSDGLLTLFSAILRISDVEGGDVVRSFETLDLSALVADICDTYLPAIDDAGRSLICDVKPNVSVTGDRELIAQALINLLDNAQFHTPMHTNISVGLSADYGMARIRVVDDGPGVKPADRARIVKRFVRLDDSRGTPGHGLGLNLVSAIATAHGGTLTIDGDGPSGLCATIAIPLAK